MLVRGHGSCTFLDPRFRVQGLGLGLWYFGNLDLLVVGCQNYGPFWGPKCNAAAHISGIQQETI